MKKLLLLLLFPLISFGQSPQDYEICAALGNVSSFSSNNEAYNALNDITSTVGMSPNFRLLPCDNVPNATAFTINGERYIFYDKYWMQELSYNTNNNWAAMSVLAHEVGHHLEGHSRDLLLILSGVGNNVSLAKRKMQELEADEFSGFVLAKLGASLNEATSAIRVGMPWTENDTYSTHPSSRKRLNAIKRGYKKANVNSGLFGTIIHYFNWVLNIYQDAAFQIHSVIPIPIGFITWLLFLGTIFLLRAVFRDVFAGTEILEKFEKWENLEEAPSKVKKSDELIDKFLDNTIGKLLDFFDKGSYIERKNKSESERVKKISFKSRKRFKVGYVAKEVYKVGKFGSNTYKLINSKGVKVGSLGTSRGLRFSAYNNGMAVQAYVDKNGRKYYRKVDINVYNKALKNPH